MATPVQPSWKQDVKPEGGENPPEGAPEKTGDKE
jgi:hypothetical protein